MALSAQLHEIPKEVTKELQIITQHQQQITHVLLVNINVWPAPLRRKRMSIRHVHNKHTTDVTTLSVEVLWKSEKKSTENLTNVATQ